MALVSTTVGACRYDLGAVPRPADDAGADQGPDRDDAGEASEVGGGERVPDAPCGVPSVLRVDGEACTCEDECASGVCTEGVCCNQVCAGHCESCRNVGWVGTCRPRPPGDDAHGACADQGPASCGFDGKCDGQGGCRRYPAGTICAGVCSGPDVAATACDGQGHCTTAVSIACAPYRCSLSTGDALCAFQCSDDRQCADGVSCAKQSCGPKPDGALCNLGGECRSGFCADSVCCEKDCDIACATCNRPDAPGRCLPTAAGEPDPHGLCHDEGMASCGSRGLCDGMGGCQSYPEDFVCAPGRMCTGGQCS
jgi:hypothetical protein